MHEKPTSFLWLRYPRGTWVTLRFRLENAVRDMWDRHAHGLCCEMPAGLPGSPGYHFWRCGLKRGHEGVHRSVNYLWNELSPGNGASTYSPVDSPPAGCDRKPVRTRRQARLARVWHAERDRQREQEALS